MTKSHLRSPPFSSAAGDIAGGACGFCAAARDTAGSGSPSPDATRPAREPDRSGWLIVFEGIDGAGKSVQIRDAARWLEEQGRAIRQLYEPTGGPIGSRIRQLAGKGRDALAPEEEFRLFLEDRRWNVETNILPALKRGEVVLLDRYYISSIAYQGALGLDPERIRRENEAFAPVPDRVYLLDLPPGQAEARIRAGRGDVPNLFERTEYLVRVANIFHSLDMPCILRLDATQPVEEIQSAIRRDLARLLGIPRD